MSINNAQYNSILREYDRKLAQDREDFRLRQADAYERIPQLKELSRQAGSSALERYRKYLAGGENALGGFEREISGIEEEKRRLLAAAGLPEDYLEMRYDCPDCRDTGFIDGEKCHCFRAREMQLMYAQSRLGGVVEKENFSTFSWEYYDDSKVIAAVGMTQLEYMRKIRNFCENFREGNILFTGNAGTGKTFLSNCIADRFLKDRKSVIYLTAIELFDVLVKTKIEKCDDPGITGTCQNITECDLLIIDDLGSEVSNAFTNSNLFYILNRRLTEEKSTIISTNLSLNVMRDVYSERITSRIQSGYSIIPVYGDDIRLKK